MNRYSLLTFLILSSGIYPLNAQESALKIESQTANYDGHNITLHGDVLVENDLAKMEAQQIELVCQSVDDSKEYLLKLRGNVKITLPQGGQLTSASAEIDCRERLGKFYSGETQQEVVFTDARIDKQGKPVSFTVKGQQMFIQLEPANSKAALRSLTAEGKVTAIYNDLLTATADRAVYENGRIQFCPKNPQGLCKVTLKDIGTLINNQEIVLSQSSQPLFQATGNSTFSVKNGADNSLTCDGIVALDSSAKVLTMQPSEESQLVFRDGMGEIHGDALTMHYALGQDTLLHPQKMLLKGHVRLLTRSAIDPEKPQAFFEYILADQMEYSPDTKEADLIAYHPHRVLLYDRVNHLQVSAPQLKLKRDQRTQKETFEGIGDVRFRFTEEEAAQFRMYGMREEK